MSPLLGALTSAGVILGGLGPNPVPEPTGGPRELDPNTVTPGVLGFLATAAVVLVSIFLIVNLVHRMRRLRHRAAAEEAAELARREQLRERSLDRGTAGDDGRGGPELPPGADVVQGEVRGEPRDHDRHEAHEPDEPGTSDSPRT
ncbi:hypothetical protein FHN55_10485 [Streptomyces sp. NP160]|uniref:hypothetical protein n=1 Tax=Streptomyces sp. NP160 TaxID=2586637 RepID=UPI001118C082|nr:hypothetical protein [Streptomyces sp. NP160]TNM67468.1 hypothetical protein FHN55_10485 [Streptomyces sp. NP160]